MKSPQFEENTEEKEQKDILIKILTIIVNE